MNEKYFVASDSDEPLKIFFTFLEAFVSGHNYIDRKFLRRQPYMKNWQISNGPEHLQGLIDVLNKNQYPTEVLDEDYAKAAFDLILVAEGDKDALKRVSAFIQAQHSSRKCVAQRFNDFRDNVHTWIGWATNWTQRKAS